MGGSGQLEASPLSQLNQFGANQGGADKNALLQKLIQIRQQQGGAPQPSQSPTAPIGQFNGSPLSQLFAQPPGLLDNIR